MTAVALPEVEVVMKREGFGHVMLGLAQQRPTFFDKHEARASTKNTSFVISDLPPRAFDIPILIATHKV